MKTFFGSSFNSIDNRSLASADRVVQPLANIGGMIRNNYLSTKPQGSPSLFFSLHHSEDGFTPRSYCDLRDFRRKSIGGRCFHAVVYRERMPCGPAFAEVLRGFSFTPGTAPASRNSRIGLTLPRTFIER